MAKPWAKPLYNSKKWQDTRKAYIANRILVDGGLCEECHDAPGRIVHHKIELTPDNVNNPDIAFNFSNLELVCKDCHDAFEGHWKPRKKDDGPPPRCLFGPDGYPIEAPH